MMSISIWLVLGGCSIILLLQLFLSFRKSKWFCLLPVLFLIIFSLSLTMYYTHELSSYTVKHLESYNENGHKLTITVRFNKSGDVIDFSPVSVFDGEGVLLDSLYIEFNKHGNLSESDVSRLYRKDVSVLLGSQKLSGYPALNSDTKKMVKISDGGYMHPLFPLAWSIFPCIAMLLIHIVVRIAVKKKRRKKELEKMKINNL